MSVRSALYAGSVMHRRLRPKPHRLRYRVFWMLLDLDEIELLAKRLPLFSRNRVNAVSFYDADHGDRSGRPLRPQIDQMLCQADFDPSGGSVQLLCMPRIFGYGFNPLSVYFCRDRHGEMTAVIYEVHNTFGECHSYLIPAGEADGMINQNCRKIFYVSPFMGMDMDYEFRLRVPDERVSLAIRATDAGGPILVAALAGNRRALSNANLLSLSMAYPLLTLKVIGAIHWHALRLWLKGIRLRRRPLPPSTPVTIVRTEG
jgi:uncharacterized protein